MVDLNWIKYLLPLFPIIAFLILYLRGKKVLKNTFPKRKKSDIECEFNFCSIYLYKDKIITRHYITGMAQIVLFKSDFWITAFPIAAWETKKGNDSMMHAVTYENVVSFSIEEKKFLFGKKRGVRLVFKDNNKLFDYFITCNSSDQLLSILNSKLS